MAKEVFDMNKIKQIFKFSTFALLSCFLAGSGFLLSTINPTPINAQVVEENISNNTPVFFSNDGYESEVYFSPTGSSPAIVKFDFIEQADRNADKKDDYIYKSGDTTVYPEDDGYVEPTTNYTNYEKIKIYRYYPDGLNADDTPPTPINANHYYYIDINSIAISLNGLDGRKFASQGQQRSVALAMKLAEAEMYKREKGEYPVMLLDDVLSELDRDRQRTLIRLTSGMQTLLTCTEPPELGVKAKKFRIGGEE